ncbi:predicted protein [Botrytis cinerea T4]|uniref:Uncharacterized protein n=1 Tax=Botryotinia fuckeliana (strain T4) TaxID=999810 RepID=G2YXG0_BOTF4|nr:predicted protein [Botrytis cinerea T4]
MRRDNANNETKAIKFCLGVGGGEEEEGEGPKNTKMIWPGSRTNEPGPQILSTQVRLYVSRWVKGRLPPFIIMDVAWMVLPNVIKLISNG